MVIIPDIRTFRNLLLLFVIKNRVNNQMQDVYTSEQILI